MSQFTGAVCETIRAQKTDHDIPIFIVTSRDDAASVERAYELGATDFLTKPIDFKFLQEQIKEALEAAN